MKSDNITITWKEYNDAGELTPEDRELIAAAREVSQNAWAPYSGFSVGAALRLSDGTILTGTNVENAAFPSGICAERNVLSSFASGYAGKKPVSMAIAARTSDGLISEPVSPCGNCRQVIAEEEHRSGVAMRIILSGTKKILVFEKGGDLLPVQFNRESLRAGRP